MFSVVHFPQSEQVQSLIWHILTEDETELAVLLTTDFFDDVLLDRVIGLFNLLCDELELERVITVRHREPLHVTFLAASTGTEERRTDKPMTNVARRYGIEEMGKRYTTKKGHPARLTQRTDSVPTTAAEPRQGVPFQAV